MEKNNFSVEGKLKAIFETQNVSATFKKREFVLEINDGSQYAQLVKFEFIQDKTAKLDLMKNGESVQVDFSLKGREWTDPQGQKKFFTTLNALDIHLLSFGGGSRPAAADEDTGPDFAPPSSLPEDDLPF